MTKSIARLGADLAATTAEGGARGCSVRYGRLIGRTADGALATVEVDGGTVTAQVSTSVDVGAAIGSRVMLLVSGNIATVVATVGTAANAKAFTATASDASTARTDAAAAKTDAAQAITDAANAAKTATNYIATGDEGIVVGDMTAAGLGGNTLIDADGMAIRDGSTELARFGATEVALGSNSTTAKVSMCGGVASIQGSTNGGGDGITMRSQWVAVHGERTTTLSARSGAGTSAVSASVDAGYPDAGGVGDMRVQLRASSGQSASSVSEFMVWPSCIWAVTPTLKLSGDGAAASEYPMARVRRHLSRDVYTGSKAIQVSGYTAVLWTAEEFAAEFGAAYNQGTSHVSLSNGDTDACTATVCAGIRPSDGAVLAVFDSSLSKWVRVDYMVYV